MKNITKNLYEFSATSALKFLVFILIFSATLLAFDYDAEYLEINKTYQLNNDGSVIETYHNKIKLHTWNATQRYFGEDFIIYNPEFQELKIHKSVTTMVDGKIVETPPNGYNEVLPRGAVGDASLTALREMVVTHTGLERGCIVDFEYSITSKSGFLPGIMGEVVFAQNNPINSYKLTIIIPKDMNLQFEVKNSDMLVKKSIKDGNNVYTWKTTNIPPALTEPNRVKLEDNQPKVVFSSFKNWNELFAEFKESIDQKDNLSVEMQMKVDELTESFSDDFEKVDALQNFVSQNTGVAEIDPIYVGYKIKDVQTTYNENSGTALDKAVLLSSMLNYNGLDAYPALVSKSSIFCDSIPSLAQFDEVVVNVRCDGENLLVSPIHSIDFSPEGTGKYLFRLDKKLKKIHQLKNFNEKINCQSMTLNLELCKDLKLSGKGTLNYGGKYNPYLKLRDNDKAAMTISGSIGKMTADNTTITRLSSKMSSINADLKSEPLKPKDGYIYLQLPQFSKGFTNSHITTALTKRETVLDLQNCQSEEYDIQIKLPKNVKTISYKVKEYAKSEIGYVRVKIYSKEDLLYVKKSLILKKDNVEPTEYSEFRKMIKLWEKEKHNQIVLKICDYNSLQK